MKTLRENFEGTGVVETDWVRSVLAEVPAVVWEGRGLIGQPDFAMEFVSDYAETLLGYPTRRWIEEPGFWLQIVHPDDRGFASAPVSATLPHGPRPPVEFRWRTAAGKYLWAQGQSIVLLNEACEIRGTRGVTFDITARKEAELEAQAVSEQLAHLSRMGVLNELGGAIAHELNQPLTAILASAQAALRYLRGAESVPAEVVELLRTIAEQSRRGGEIISHLRAMMRKEEAKMERLSINGVIRKLLRLIHSDLVARNITVATELAPDLPAVRADTVQLQQLLLNLILNGCEAMSSHDAARRQLAIRTSPVDGAGIEIAVCDRGAGIREEVLETMFEPFTTTKRQGLGMGLAICRTIATAHGGKLTAQNNEDAGAVFSFYLPAEKKRP